MKLQFSSYDVVCSVAELQKLIGMRVNKIYDIDHRTYLIRLHRSEEKCVLLIESGIRIHTTEFDWQKNVAPSSFSMKMRKHLKNKRLESLTQIGVDRIIDLQFGSGDAAYHVILELYDHGNIVLTDHEMMTLNILRHHTDSDKIRYAVKEKYPVHCARTKTMPPLDDIRNRIQNAKTGDALKKVLNPLVEFGPAIIDHVLLKAGFPMGCKIGMEFNVTDDILRLNAALQTANEMMETAKNNSLKGYIIQRKELKNTVMMKDDCLYTNIEFHPFLFEQHKEKPHKCLETFNAAVDEYFSSMQGQKLDMKALQQEREAWKKLENVKKDHEQRLEALETTQKENKQKADLISRNQKLVSDAIMCIQAALANQMSWPDIMELVKDAQEEEDPVATAIRQLKLETNHISLLLHDPFEYSDDEEPELKPMVVDIDLAYTAFGNARKYYDQKRSAAKKQQKTIESQGKALKSAEKKTKQTLKEVQAVHSINKVRKTYWFEKFYWFISSENYLVISGRDQQQNELIVKRYLKTGDLYVHADLTGASSVIIKNPTGKPVPPKTLAEAGSMAIAYSNAWEAKVVAGAWWVHHDQVSKTAPTGEYLTTGSFMIRGKKNYLSPSKLIVGLAVLFRLEESSIEHHLNERRVRTIGEENENDLVEIVGTDKEIEVNDSDEGENPDNKDQLNTINEEPHIEECSADDNNCDEVRDSNDEKTVPQFPDTQIKIDLSGPTMKLRVENAEPLITENVDEENVIYLGDDKPITITTSQKKNSRNKEQPQSTTQNNKNNKDTNNEQVKKTEQAGLKRGQKGRLKKMKEKYKDQDEEDRRLSMAVLQSAGAAKEDKRKNKNKDPSGPKQQTKRKGTGQPRTQPQDNHLYDRDEDTGPGPEVDMLDQLTGKPLPEDELLFAVPVIAPYNTLLNYKYKVKLTPGNVKPGKAAKTAIAVFLKDKEITSREKDLLKAIKEEIIARNMPGRVKLSTPQLQKVKK